MKTFTQHRHIVVLALLLCVPAAGQAGPVTAHYGHLTLTGGVETGHFPQWWDLTRGDLVLSFTYDATGLIDDFGADAHAWAEAGVRSPCDGDFHPTWLVEGSGVWLATSYDPTAHTFDPDPPGAPALDPDDKLILQKGGGLSEDSYDLPSVPPNPWSSHAIRFDRDGVAAEALQWGVIDGVTYNTSGRYHIVMTLCATSLTSGEAHMTVNGEPQGFYVPEWHDGPADLMPAGMTFTGDMEHLQIFYGIYGYGSVHTIAFEDMIAIGFPGEPPLAACLEKAIAVKPGSDPSPINLKSQGVTAVAVLSSEDFDAMAGVDPGTVLFAGAAPLRWTFENVAAGSQQRNSPLDLLLFFDTQELDLTAESTAALLTGYLTDGEFFWGVDAVKIVPDPPKAPKVPKKEDVPSTGNVTEPVAFEPAKPASEPPVDPAGVHSPAELPAGNTGAPPAEDTFDKEAPADTDAGPAAASEPDPSPGADTADDDVTEPVDPPADDAGAPPASGTGDGPSPPAADTDQDVSDKADASPTGDTPAADDVTDSPAVEPKEPPAEPAPAPADPATDDPTDASAADQPGDPVDPAEATVIRCVPIDIKPCSCPNAINLKSKGVVPVAVLSSADFDAALCVNPETVTFAAALPLRWAYEDAGSECDENDGRIDLLLFFDTRDLQFTTDDTEAIVTGAAADGTLFWGLDTVKVKGAKTK